MHDSNADSASNKYHVQIDEGQNIVIGDHAQVVQQVYNTLPEPHVDLTAAEKIYRQRVVKKYNWVGFVPDESLTHLTLQDVFVRPALIKVSRVPLSEERTSQAERGEPGQPKEIREPIELDKVLSNHLDKASSNHLDKPHMLIVGEPGAGKSALLRWLAVAFAGTPQQETTRSGPSAGSDRLPVLVELGHLPPRYLQAEGETPNWEEYLLHEHFSSLMGFPNTPPQLLREALYNGRSLLLFDGLDEVADDAARGRLADSLAELAHLFPGNLVVIGSRPAGVRGCEDQLRRQFQRYEIQRFTLDDVQELCSTWKADALFAKVQVNPATLELATTPLLCAMLILIRNEKGALPERRVKLYEECCRNLIERWEPAHRVKEQGVPAKLRWEDHWDLLASLAYEIHSQEKRTSATREELVPALVRTLQAKQAYTKREAKEVADRFLDALSRRSGLLQDKGNGIYGFPHPTFQEYLAARYIAEQPDSQHIDLVMQHLHESWWQEVHLLTIAHLGSGSKEASKASELILQILHRYKRPWWILRSSKNRWLRENGPGKLLPQVQLERRIAWMLDRELELAVRGYAECTSDGTTGRVSKELSRRAKALVWHTLNDDARYVTRETLRTIADQLSHRGNHGVKETLQKARNHSDWEVQKRAKNMLAELGDDEKVVSDLQAPLHGTDGDEGRQAAASLGQMEVSHEEVVNDLLTALCDPGSSMRSRAAMRLGDRGVGNQQVASALSVALRDPNVFVRRAVAESLGQVGIANQEVVDALLAAALYDPKGSVRTQAAESLEKIGIGNQTVADILLTTLREPGVNERMRMQVAGILGRVGNQAGVDILLAALRSPHWHVRDWAAESLGRVGAVNQAGVDALAVALRNPDRNVRRQVVNQAGVDALAVALRDPDREVRHQAAVRLSQIGVRNEEVTRGLLAALRSPHWHVRDWAALYLGRLEIQDKIQLRRVLVALNGCLHDKGPDNFPDKENNVRQTALMAIRQLLDGRPIPGY